MANKIRVTIWNEFRHEKTKEKVRAIYPNGLHATIGEFLSENDDIEVTLAALDDEYQGLPDSVLENTDVLIWWGHMVRGRVETDRRCVGFDRNQCGASRLGRNAYSRT